MNQDRKRDQDMANRQSNMGTADRPHDDSRSEQGRGADGERSRMESGSPGPSNSGGITNRPLDRERREQQQVRERGQSHSER